MKNIKDEAGSRQQTAVLAFVHADLGYGKRIVLSDLNLVLRAGDFLGIVGPNGTGKTTILKAMLGVLRPLRGQIDRDTKARLGYVPQRQFIDEVYPLTVLDVVLMGRYPVMGVFDRPGRSDRQMAQQCLEHVGIADLAGRLYRELSGGQKQRTLIARALAIDPRVLVLDEPTNDMDIGSEHAIMELLTALNEHNGITVVMVSHLLNVVANYVKTIALIDGGLDVVGTTEEVLCSERLSDVYGIPIEVASYGRHKVILTGERDA